MYLFFNLEIAAMFIFAYNKVIIEIVNFYSKGFNVITCNLNINYNLAQFQYYIKCGLVT